MGTGAEDNIVEMCAFGSGEVKQIKRINDSTLHGHKVPTIYHRSIPNPSLLIIILIS